MILLETGDGQGPAVPWDRDLVLSGDVRSFPLADLLSLIHSAGKSGFVLFQHEKHEKAIYLNRGEVVFAESNLDTDRRGAFLLRSGRITHEQLALAERRWSVVTSSRVAAKTSAAVARCTSWSPAKALTKPSSPDRWAIIRSSICE